MLTFSHTSRRNLKTCLASTAAVTSLCTVALLGLASSPAHAQSPVSPPEHDVFVIGPDDGGACSFPVQWDVTSRSLGLELPHSFLSLSPGWHLILTNLRHWQDLDGPRRRDHRIPRSAGRHHPADLARRELHTAPGPTAHWQLVADNRPRHRHALRLGGQRHDREYLRHIVLTTEGSGQDLPATPKARPAVPLPHAGTPLDKRPQHAKGARSSNKPARSSACEGVRYATWRSC